MADTQQKYVLIHDSVAERGVLAENGQTPPATSRGQSSNSTANLAHKHTHWLSPILMPLPVRPLFVSRTLFNSMAFTASVLSEISLRLSLPPCCCGGFFSARYDLHTLLQWAARLQRLDSAWWGVIIREMRPPKAPVTWQAGMAC